MMKIKNIDKLSNLQLHVCVGLDLRCAVVGVAMSGMLLVWLHGGGLLVWL